MGSYGTVATTVAPAAALPPGHDTMDEDGPYSFSIMSYSNISSTGVSTPVLRGVQASIPPGRLCAILGESKGALFDVLTGEAKGRTVGRLPRIDNVTMVPSENLMVEYETVEDIMWFYADLTLPSFTQAQKRALIEQAVSDVHLEHRYHSVVGAPSPEYEPGGGRLSSGERRRLQVAALLLSRPHVVLLDEPTTGLDASMAMQLLLALKGLCQTRNMIVAACLHQPRREIYQELDYLLLLSHGYGIYFGLTSAMEEAVSTDFRPLFRQENPADYAMEYVCSLTEKQAELAKDRNQLRLPEDMLQGKDVMIDGSGSSYKRNFAAKDRPPFQTRIYVLIRRMIHANTYPHSAANFVPIYTFMGIAAVILALCCFKIRKDQVSDVQNFVGIQVLLVFVFTRISMVGEISIIVWRLVWYAERLHGLYTAMDLLTAFEAVAICNTFVSAVWMYMIVWIIGGWDYSEWSSIPMIFAVVFLPMQALRALSGIAFTTSSDVPSGGSKVLTLLLLLQLFGGCLVNMTVMTDWLNWLCFFNPFFYIFFGLMKVELTDYNKYNCLQLDPDDPNSVWCLKGDEVLESYGFDHVPLALVMVCLPIYFVMNTINLYALENLDFSVMKVEPSRTSDDGIVSKALHAIYEALSPYRPINDMEEVAEKERDSVLLPKKDKMLQDVQDAPRSYFKYSNIVYRVTDGEGNKSIILGVRDDENVDKSTGRRGISFQVRVNSLFAILGPSGAGKTCLLRIMSNMPVPGEIEMDNQDDNTLKEVKYVADVNVISPMDTVAEVVQFYAEFVLVDLVPTERKRRVDEVLRQLRLDHVRQTFVGGRTPSGATMDGITRSETRLLSIGCAILKQPHILVLDEPTSGLHSQAARDVLMVMQNLATTNSTVICSIHQPSLSIYNMFEAVIIMASGQVVYGGSPSVSAAAFEHATGNKIKQYENPADFILDCVGSLNQAQVISLMAKLPPSTEDTINLSAGEDWVASHKAALAAHKEEEDLLPQTNAVISRSLRFIKAVHLLSFRSLRHMWRDPRLFIQRVGLPFVGACLIGSPFASMSATTFVYSSEIYARECLILLTMSYIYFLSAPTAAVVQRSRLLYLHEITLGIYSPLEIYSSLILVSIVLYVLVPASTVFLIVSTISGLRPGVQYWLCSHLDMLMVGTFCEVFATYVGIGVGDEQTASTIYDSIFNVLLLPCTGILIGAHDIEYPMKAIAYANPLRLAVETEILNVFEDRPIITDSNDFYYQYTNGNQVVRDLGFDVVTGVKWGNQVALAGCIFLLCVFGYRSLAFTARKLTW